MTRSRRAGLSRDEARRQPLYARMLGLQYLAPSGFLCFVFLEGAIALGILLALAELVSWWGVLVLPVTVAVMVKLNDAVAGALTRASTGASRPASGARGAGSAGRGPGGRRSASAGRAIGGREAGELGVMSSDAEFRSAGLGDAGHGVAVAEAGLCDIGLGPEPTDAARELDVLGEIGFPVRDDDGVGGSGVYASSRAKSQDAGLTRRKAAATGSDDATQRLSRRRSHGVQTVRLPPSVIAQAGRDAGHDQSAYGTRATDRPVTPESESESAEPGIDLSTQELDRFSPGRPRRFAPEPDEIDPFPADRSRLAPELTAFAPEAGSFVPESFTSAPLEPEPLASAPFKTEPFTSGPFKTEPFTSAPLEADSFAPVPLEADPFAPAQRTPEPFAPAPLTSEPFAPEADRFSAASDPFSSEPYPLRPGYGSPSSTGPDAMPDESAGPRPPAGRKRWTTRDDDYLPPAAGGFRSGQDATEPELFPATDPSTFPTDPSAINGPRATTPWPAQLDDQDQRTRQSASRRYE
ncbi:hypothetical protein COUCH_31870 [Couchioplanes caeruleus]|nr:hypothetical protein [Couchioplanes caeruleus]UQU63562.1 hypothetical protein COUCH_31870 [Couchioplanes caeruleus]